MLRSGGLEANGMWRNNAWSGVLEDKQPSIPPGPGRYRSRHARRSPISAISPERDPIGLNRICEDCALAFCFSFSEQHGPSERVLRVRTTLRWFRRRAPGTPAVDFAPPCASRRAPGPYLACVVQGEKPIAVFGTVPIAPAARIVAQAIARGRHAAAPEPRAEVSIEPLCHA